MTNSEPGEKKYISSSRIQNTETVAQLISAIVDWSKMVFVLDIIKTDSHESSQSSSRSRLSVILKLETVKNTLTQAVDSKSPTDVYYFWEATLPGKSLTHARGESTIGLVSIYICIRYRLRIVPFLFKPESTKWTLEIVLFIFITIFFFFFFFFFFSWLVLHLYWLKHIIKL